MNFGKVNIKIEARNIERFINYCIKQNIKIYNLNKKNEENCEVVINYKDYLKYKKNLASRYGAVGVKYFNVVNKNTVSHFPFGFCAGLIIFGLMFIFSLQFIWSINILGIERINKSELLDFMQKNDYTIGSRVGNIINEELEQRLIDSFPQISLVSVAIKGTTLQINIKEKEYELNLDDTQILPIVADCDGVITQITVTQGTARVKVGDIVKKGDILIDAFTADTSGKVMPIRACGEVKAKVWVTGESTFTEGQSSLKRSGKSVTVSDLSLFGLIFPSKTTKNTFEYYQTETEQYYTFFNFILPFKTIKTTYYELKEYTETRSFDEIKEELVEQSKLKAYSNLNSAFEVEDEQTHISSNNGVYIVITYLQVTKNISTY